MFQNYALWPYMTVTQCRFWPALTKMPKEERQATLSGRDDEAPDRRLCGSLSNAALRGQQQRVALARMLAVNPGVLLLDEPFSNLDASRLEMRAELRRIHEAFGTTIVFVSHDQWEAMTLATTIAVMNEGQLQQVGTPDDIHIQP
ncbi:ABC transporter ATP-binding protein [Vibrio sp. PP-XX7]